MVAVQGFAGLAVLVVVLGATPALADEAPPPPAMTAEDTRRPSGGGNDPSDARGEPLVPLPTPTTPPVASPAAPPSAPPSTVPPPSTTHWYGWHVIGADVGAVVLISLAAATESEPLAWLGAATWLVGAPIVHWTHDRAGAGGTSLALRAGLPLGGALVGGLTCTDRGEFACLGQAIGGFGLGMLGAMVIDYALLAYEARPVSTGVQLGIVPRAGGGLTFALGATF